VHYIGGKPGRQLLPEEFYFGFTKRKQRANKGEFPVKNQAKNRSGHFPPNVLFFLKNSESPHSTAKEKYR